MFKFLMINALLAGFCLSICLAPLGCFLLWRKQAFFGDGLAHSALLGVALSIYAGVAPWWGIILVSLLLSYLLSFARQAFQLSADSWLGLLSYTLISGGYLLIKYVSKIGLTTANAVENFLFGDLFFLDMANIINLCFLVLFVGSLLFFFWKKFLLVTIDSQMASLQGINPAFYNFLLLFMLSTVIATTLPLVGSLLVPGLLIMPAACARLISISPEEMMVKAGISSLIMIWCGIFFSYFFDWPVGPTSMIVGFVLLLLLKGFQKIRYVYK